MHELFFYADVVDEVLNTAAYNFFVLFQELDDADMEEAAMVQRIAERAEEKLKNRGAHEVTADIAGTRRKVTNAKL